LFSFGTFIGYVFDTVESMFGLLGKMREAKPAFDRISEIIDHPTEKYDGLVPTDGRINTSAPDIAVAESHTPAAGGESAVNVAFKETDSNDSIENLTPAVRGNLSEYGNNIEYSPIEFDQVCFSYDNKTDVLKNVSFKLEKNKTTALVGASGSGKSTIIKLICGFYNVHGGTIKIYGKDLDKCNIKKVRELISLMSQDVYLFPATIKENISLGRNDASPEEIIEAAKMANAHNFIMKLPDGYNTVVGEMGNNLSGGQCQRIMLARAILKNAPILLLDEPTAYLDTQSEKLLQEALERFMENRTVLAIAHQLSTIKNADRVIVLNNGSIVEEGCHESLINGDTIYKRLYHEQMEQYKKSDICQLKEV